MTFRSREPDRIIRAQRTIEGGGFAVRRPFPTRALSDFDPFLLIDEMGPSVYRPGEAVGAPDHPHRGFETVTYLLDGEFEHEDSAGNRGTLRPGDVQWMTAGDGVVHSEMPSERIRRDGGRVHGFQVWVNLPAKRKRTAPRYQEISGASLPVAKSADGKVAVKVIAGEALGVAANIETHTPILYFDVTVEPGGSLKLATPQSYNVAVYVFEGRVGIGDEAEALNDGDFAMLGEGDTLVLNSTGDRGARLLVLGGEPLHEPVARYGPFVMNTEAEVRQAVEDFRSGRFARISRR
ncbi:MAG TPA: pirin family protein [Casimicrobiaceae bacterium]|nr:pirin family protein [Casimicrobiaceae bacterium]